MPLIEDARLAGESSSIILGFTVGGIRGGRGFATAAYPIT